LRGPFGTFAHNFCFIFKNILLASELIKHGSRVVHLLLNKTMKTKGETMKEESQTIFGERGDRGDSLVRKPLKQQI